MSSFLELAKYDDAYEIQNLINTTFKKREKDASKNRVTLEDIQNYILDAKKYLFVVKDIHNRIIVTILVEDCNAHAHISLLYKATFCKEDMLGVKVLKVAEEFIVNSLMKNKIIVYIYFNQDKIKTYYERLGYKNTNEYTSIIGIKLCVYQKVIRLH
jgi:hypothetical protein